MAITTGSKLDLLYSATEGEKYTDAFRTFLAGMDALVQASILSSTTTTPPTSPSQGDAYIIPTGATGEWAGHTNLIAVWQTSAASGADWQFIIPKVGFIVYDVFGVITGQPGFRIFDGTNWGLPNAFAQPINFVSGIKLNGSQTLLSTSGNGTDIATTAGSLTTGRVLTADANSNVEESAVSVSDLATLSSANVFTQTQTTQAGIESNADVDLVSTTPATNVANVEAPSLTVQGNVWNGTASITDEWTVEAVLGTGSEPASTLTFNHAGSTGAATVSIPSALITANLTATNFLHTETTIPATSSANQNAPELQLTGSYWNGTAAANDNWTVEQILGSGANPTSTLQVIHNGSSGALPTVSVPNLEITTATVATFASNSGSITPPTQVVGYLQFTINGGVVLIPYYQP